VLRKLIQLNGSIEEDARAICMDGTYSGSHLTPTWIVFGLSPS
jgi:hypothetical protein